MKKLCTTAFCGRQQFYRGKCVDCNIARNRIKATNYDAEYRRHRRAMVRSTPEDQRVCWICRKGHIKGQKWSVDHVIPIVKGGRHAPHNMRWAHLSCNASRQDKPV